MSQGVMIIIAIFAAIAVIAGFFISKLLKRNKQQVHVSTDAKPQIQKLTGVLNNILEKLKIEGNNIPKETVSLDGVINALVVDVKKKMFRPMHVDLIPNKDYGRQWDYLTHSNIYWLKRNTDGTMEKMVPHEVLTDSPTELYEAVQTADDMEEVFGWQDTGGNKSKLFLMVIAALVTLFIMFMAMTYKKNGG